MYPFKAVGLEYEKDSAGKVVGVLDEHGQRLSYIQTRDAWFKYLASSSESCVW